MTLAVRFAWRYGATAAAAATVCLGLSAGTYALRLGQMERDYESRAAESIEREMRRQGEAALRLFAESAKPALIDGDEAALSRLARSLRDISTALELRAYDTAGRLIATSDGSTLPAFLRADAPESLRGVRPAQEVVRWREGRELLVGMPVCVGGLCFGSVAVSVDGAAPAGEALEDFAAAQTRFPLSAAAIGLGFVAFAAAAAALVGARAGGRLDRSVRRVVENLDRVSAGRGELSVEPIERALSELAFAVDRVAEAMEAARARGEAAAAVDDLPDGLFVARPTGRLVVANPALHALLRAEGEELVGRDVRELLGFEAEPEAAQLADALRGVEEVPLRDGARLKVVISARPTGDGEVEARVVGLMRDATELIARQEAFESERRRADAAERAKADFLSIVSHELKTPLNGILGGAAVLAGGELTPKQRAFVDIVQSSGKALLSTIGGMLDLARLERGEAQIEPQPVDLGRLAEEIVARVTGGAEAKSLDLFLHAEPGAPVVMTDREKLLDIGVALADNAVKFTDSGHVAIRIGASVQEGQASIALSVEDTGPGIGPDKIDSIFDSFSQSDSSAARRHGGAGLGLAIVRKLTDLLGGRIDVTSVPGVGSTFTVRFDAAVDPDWRSGGQRLSPRLAEAPYATAPHLRGAARVVLAEANETNRIVLSAFLRKSGFACHVASNGYEAMKLVRDLAPALVIMDSGMAVMSGLEAAKAIRRREHEEGAPATPIIGLTDKREGGLERCAAAGMNDAVLKPVRLEELRSKIEQWITAGATEAARLSAG